MRLQQRRISLELVRRTVEHPDRAWPDAGDPDAKNAVKRFHRLNDSVVRVVYNHTKEPWVIITAFFERKGRARK
jgi:hypothetical protein